ncbi:MAG: LysE family translocator [Pseudomonadota bacterium]
MPPLESILAVTLAGLALSITPGPSMLYVLSRSVGQSRGAGFASALGLGIGGMLLAVATALGLAAAFAAFDWIVPTLRLVGSIYLVWLGVGMIREARATANVAFDAESVDRSSFSNIVWQGVWVELLNPKTVLFFALFLPPFIDMTADGGGTASVQLQFLLLGILVPLTAIPSDVLVALMGSTASKLINNNPAGRQGLAWLGGVTLIAIALNLLLGIV